MNMKVNTCCIISFKFTFSLNNSIEEIDISGSRGNVSVVIALHPFAYPSSFLVQVYIRYGGHLYVQKCMYY